MKIEVDKNVKLMGIVNVTPDSFYDGGNFNTTTKAVEHALKLIDEGADIIDIGGESTRPPGVDYNLGAERISEQLELERVIPVIEKIISLRPNTVISIDTMKPQVAHEALLAGACMINDVSAGQFDEAIWEVAKKFQVPYVLMHGYNPHKIVPVSEVEYMNVVEEVYNFLQTRIKSALQTGVKEIYVDIGIGFAKNYTHNITLMQNHEKFLGLGVPIITGVSRKSFIGNILGGVPPNKRLFGTLAANLVAIAKGASIVRVHDVWQMKEFLKVWNELL